MVRRTYLLLARARAMATCVAIGACAALGPTHGHVVVLILALVFVTVAMLGFHARARIEARIEEIFAAGEARCSERDGPVAYHLLESELDELDEFSVAAGHPRGTIRRMAEEFAENRRTRHG